MAWISHLSINYLTFLNLKQNQSSSLQEHCFGSVSSSFVTKCLCRLSSFLSKGYTGGFDSAFLAVVGAGICNLGMWGLSRPPTNSGKWDVSLASIQVMAHTLNHPAWETPVWQFKAGPGFQPRRDRFEVSLPTSGALGLPVSPVLDCLFFNRNIDCMTYIISYVMRWSGDLSRIVKGPHWPSPVDYLSFEGSHEICMFMLFLVF